MHVHTFGGFARNKNGHFSGDVNVISYSIPVKCLKLAGTFRKSNSILSANNIKTKTQLLLIFYYFFHGGLLYKLIKIIHIHMET